MYRKAGIYHSSVVDYDRSAVSSETVRGGCGGFDGGGRIFDDHNELLAALLEALPPSCHLLLVGDSISYPRGPGFVLHDLIESGCCVRFVFSQIFRQKRAD
jgi:hypothetical protein